MDKKIELTPEELEELKSDIKFREKVILQLKVLNNIPERVTILSVKVKLYGWLIGIIFTGIFGLALAYFRR